MKDLSDRYDVDEISEFEGSEGEEFAGSCGGLDFVDPHGDARLPTSFPEGAKERGGGASLNPPSPCTSSKHIAAISPGRVSSARSSAATLFCVEWASLGS